MLRFIKKYGGIIFDILIITGLVVIVFLWNPFNIFGGGVKLQNTANIVSGIRDIGQLVTAEYYGEVIASLEETELQILKESALEDRGNELLSEIKFALLELYGIDTLKRKDKDPPPTVTNTNLYKRNLNRRNISLKFEQLFPDIASDTLFNYVVTFIGREKFDRNINNVSKLRDSQKKKVLFELYSELVQNELRLNSSQFDAYLRDGFAFASKFESFYYQQNETEKLRSERNEQIVMLGRGWVKAGFDFRNLNQNNIFYDKERAAIYINGIQPSIIDVDINPWFIPEREIPGFQIISYSGNADFEDAKLVKKYCIQKLENNALQAKILEQALKNGEEALKTFFSLITGHEIQIVKFLKDDITIVFSQMMADDIITYPEALLIDSLTLLEIRKIDSLKNLPLDQLSENYIKKRKKQLSSLLKQVNGMPYQSNYYTRFNYYASKYTELANDSILNNHEYERVATLRQKILSKADSGYNFTSSSINPDLKYWYDSLNFTTEYNYFINALQTDNLAPRVAHSISISRENEAVVDSLYKKYEDRMIDLFINKANFQITYLTDSLFYPQFDTLYYCMPLNEPDIESLAIQDSINNRELSSKFNLCESPAKIQAKEITACEQLMLNKFSRYQDKSVLSKSWDWIVNAIPDADDLQNFKKGINQKLNNE
jgi:hypothetical protein